MLYLDAIHLLVSPLYIQKKGTCSIDESKRENHYLKLLPCPNQDGAFPTLIFLNSFS